MISGFFEGEEGFATLIGFQSAFQGLGAAVMTFTAGRLLTFEYGKKRSWILLDRHSDHLPYFMAFVPEPPQKKKTSLPKKQHQKGTLRPTTPHVWHFDLLSLYFP